MKKHNKCVYFHINPVKQEVFYVGIGSVKRPYHKSGRNNWWINTVNKYGYHIIIIHSNLSLLEACELEVKYIAQIGRRGKGLGSLVNGTAGGDEGGSLMVRHIQLKQKENKLFLSQETNTVGEIKTKKEVHLRQKLKLK